MILQSDDYLHRREAELKDLFNMTTTGTFTHTHYNQLQLFSRRINDFEHFLNGSSSSEDNNNNHNNNHTVEGVSVFLSKEENTSEDPSHSNQDPYSTGSTGTNDDKRMGYEIVSSDGDLQTSSDEESNDEDERMQEEDPTSDSNSNDNTIHNNNNNNDGEDDGGGVTSSSSSSSSSSFSSSTSSFSVKGTVESGKMELEVREVDAYWLQRELSAFYTDVHQCQQVEAQVLGE